MIVTQHLVVIRGDARTVTLTMAAGSQLLSAESVTFYARADTADSDAIWEQTLTPSSDTVAVATIGADEWASWTDAGEPEELHFAFRVVDGDGDTHTPGIGTITVVPSAAI